jgi:hypothetical protein
MDPQLPDAVAELATTARRAFADAGGVGVARRAEHEPMARTVAAGALRAVGAFDVDPFADVEQALAAVALCREAGRVALPYPLEAMLCRQRTDNGREFAVVLVEPRDPLVDHADLLDAVADGMAAVDLDGQPYDAQIAGTPVDARLGPFIVPVTLSDTDLELPRVDDAAALAWTLSAATLLGYVEAALDLAIEHVTTRHQFDRRIADFQAVQFQVADAVVAVQGLTELVQYTVWRVAELGAAARSDALACRLHAADVARVVLRTAQQLHGAAGVAEEYDVSVLCRRAQASLRIPVSSERIVDALASAIRDDGFAALFPQGRASARG